MTASPPLEGRYGPMLTIALFALVPYILVVSGAALYRGQVMSDLGATGAGLAIVQGLSIAGYAFGALLAGDLVNRFRQRHLFLVAEALFVLGWLLVAVSGGIVTYGAGRVLAGFATGTLLVTALPPVVRRFPADQVPFTAAFINIGLFGAVAAGPLLGGAVAANHIWRIFYGAFAGLGVLTAVVAMLSLPHDEPPNPDLSFDPHGLALGFAATALPFWASGELRAHGVGTPVVAVPLGIGVACFLALMLVEYHKPGALSPVKKMWTTFPVAGTLIAMIGGGAFVTFVSLTIEWLVRIEHWPPLAAGLLFWPQVAGALLTAALLGVLFRTRFLPVLAFSGMVLLLGGGALLLSWRPQDGHVHLLAAVGLLGLGAGATVSPGLFLAGMSLRTRILGRILALIELVRSSADFILAPVMLKVAAESSRAPGVAAAGIHRAMWITWLITLAGTLFIAALYLLGGGGLPRPDLIAWVQRDRTAIHSPPLLDAVRRRK
ncbi:MAG TPA: MFS transporter [Gammaproteobacteria bacterium]|nr:MFS transporter [Gammaproteobacteria bacterium]